MLPPRRFQIGKRSLTLKEWSSRSGIAPERIRERLKAGWALESAVWMKIRPQGMVPAGICPRCGINPMSKGYCRDCKREYRSDWIKRHASADDVSIRICCDCCAPKDSREFSPLRSYCKRCEKRRKRDWGLRSRYGVSLVEFEIRCKIQSNRCALCDVSFSVKRGNLDHDHASGVWRGVLCTPCNSALGWYERYRNTIAQYLATPTATRLLADPSSPCGLSPYRRNSFLGKCLKSRYGMTVNEFDRLRELQEDSCAICVQSFAEVRPNVDHDHATGLWRGLLCPHCNGALGWYERNKTGVVEYLDKCGCEKALEL